MRVATFNVRWGPPSYGCFKLNTNGSWRARDNVASGGGVRRDHRGDWQWGFNVKLGHCSIEEAKLWVLIIGLRQTWDKGCRVLSVEVDSFTIYNRITKDDL